MKKCRQFINTILSSVLALLGITSCIAPPMYGPAMPDNQLNIDIDAEVTNEDGEPLQSMQVVIKSARTGLVDSVYTNAAGEYRGTYLLPDYGTDTLQVQVRDTAEVYAPDTLNIPFAEMTKESESTWTTEYSVDVKVQLKKK